MSRKWPLFSLVVLATFAGFARALGQGLLDWDDAGYIVENQHIRSLSLETVRWAFTEFHCNYWAPLTWLSLALDHAVWGLEPVGYHLTNNLLHALSAGMVFLLAARVLAPRDDGSGGGLPAAAVLPAAALAALAFGLHPLRVESVAWATERKDVLSIGLGLAAVLAWLRYADRARPDPDDPGAFLRDARWWAAAGLFAASLLAKATLVTLPVLLLVLDWHPLRRGGPGRWPGLLLEKAPLLAMAVGAAAVTAEAMAPTARTLAEIGLQARVLVAFTSVVTYLRLTLVPAGISPVYFHPNQVELGLPQLGAIALVAALTAAAVGQAVRPSGPRRGPLAAWLLFLGLLLPVLGLTQNGKQELAPRFTYAAAVPLSILLAAGVALAWQALGRARAGRVALGVATAATLAAWSAVTVRDIGDWADDVALWSRVIELQPHRYGLAYAQRARFLDLRGEPARALPDLDEAVAIAERKGYGAVHEVYAQRARLRLRLGDVDGALGDLDAAVARAGPGPRDMYLLERGAVLERLGDGARARQDRQAAGGG